MQMATLSFRCTDDNGLSFELLVDCQSLGALVGSRDTAFPYSIVEDGLPRWSPYGPSDSPNVRIISVCSCGEYGCGHAQCHVTRDGDEIVFSQFDCDVSREGAGREFRFSTENYETVCKEIVDLARQRREHDDASRR